MTDVNTNKPRGFGFVRFEDEASIPLVTSERYHYLKSRWVEVKLAVPREEMETATALLGKSPQEAFKSVDVHHGAAEYAAPMNWEMPSGVPVVGAAPGYTASYAAPTLVSGPFGLTQGVPIYYGYAPSSPMSYASPPASPSALWQYQQGAGLVGPAHAVPVYHHYAPIYADVPTLPPYGAPMYGGSVPVV